MINSKNNDWRKSTAYMNDNGTLVIELNLINETTVPLSIFCLQNLQILSIDDTPFPDGNYSLSTNSWYLLYFLGIVPDSLENLRQLLAFAISDSPIVNMTERLGTLSKLRYLFLTDCSLTHLPNLSGISQLDIVDLR
jgi:hypothetical protein